jgi:hypothetical protein
MGLLNHGMESLSIKGRRSSNASSAHEEVGEGDDTSQLDKEEGNVLMTIISQRQSFCPCAILMPSGLT